MFIPSAALYSYTKESLLPLSAELKKEVIAETDRLSVRIREIAGKNTAALTGSNQWSESFLQQLSREKSDESWNSLDRILVDLPEPQSGMDREAHYRALLDAVVDRLIINRLATNTQSFLMPLISVNSSSLDRELHNVLLNEMLDFTNRLNEIKKNFENEAISQIIGEKSKEEPIM